MAEPYDAPAIGSRPHLYRLLRDTMYHTAGTILCLNDDQVQGGDMHERVWVESDADEVVRRHAERIADLSATVDDAKDKHDSLAEQLAALTARVDALEKAAVPTPEEPPAPPVAPPAAVEPEVPEQAPEPSAQPSQDAPEEPPEPPAATA